MRHRLFGLSRLSAEHSTRFALGMFYCEIEIALFGNEEDREKIVDYREEKRRLLHYDRSTLVKRH